ncbi:hypothetical protein SEH50133_13930 [Salmonella enterica subsp. houtenae serovar 50:g,z51:- str. 01-0133]|nr:hypothetical protein SEH50133_13930 [Salmonella enterica subsp. houtenae serovar 50:g,z51:- str. 01-0133]VEA91622.1 type VI secretion protein, family [Salmonella enterica subsp. houtenae]
MSSRKNDGGGSIAPKERVNIKFQPKTENQTAEVELPLNLLVTGDLTGGRDDTQLDERQPVAISRNNFNAGLGIEPITPDLLYFIDFYVFIFSRQAPDVLVAMRVCDFILCNMDYIGLIKCIVGQCV